jgi:hypothetical protein
MMAAPAHIVPVDHDAVKTAASRFYRHIRRCGQCCLMSERLCRTGRQLRDEKYRAVMQKWRR